MKLEKMAFHNLGVIEEIPGRQLIAVYGMKFLMKLAIPLRYGV